MNPLDNIPEADEIKRGQKLVDLLKLKEAKDDNDKRFNPPRYETSWGTKTALGLFRSVDCIVRGLD